MNKDGKVEVIGILETPAENEENKDTAEEEEKLMESKKGNEVDAEDEKNKDKSEGEEKLIESKKGKEVDAEDENSDGKLPLAMQMLI